MSSPKPQTPLEYKRWLKERNKRHSTASLQQKETNNSPSNNITLENNEKMHSFLSKFQIGNNNNNNNTIEEKRGAVTDKSNLDWTTLSDHLSLLHHTTSRTDEQQVTRRKEPMRTMEQLTVPVDISLKRAMELQIYDDSNNKVLEWIRNKVERLCFQHIFYSSNRCGEDEEWSDNISPLLEALKHVATIFLYPPQQDMMDTFVGDQQSRTVASVENYFNRIANSRYYPNDIPSEEHMHCKTWQLAFHSVYQQWRLGCNQFIYVIFEKFIITFVSFYSQNSDSNRFLVITENVPTRIKQAFDTAGIGYEEKQTSNMEMKWGVAQDKNNMTDQTILFQGHSQVHALYELIWNEMPQWRKLFLKTMPTIVSDKEFLHCSMTCANIRLSQDKLHSDNNIHLQIVGVLLPPSLYKLYAQMVKTSLTRWNIHLETDRRTIGSNKAIPNDIQKQFQQPFPDFHQTCEECFALVESLGKSNQQYHASWK